MVILLPMDSNAIKQMTEGEYMSEFISDSPENVPAWVRDQALADIRAYNAVARRVAKRIAKRTPTHLAALAVRLDKRAERLHCTSGSFGTASFWLGSDSAKTARRLARKIRRDLALAGHVQPIYVYVWAIDQCYGGPEEGGWYFDMGRVEEVRRAHSWKQALRHIRALREAHPTCPRGRSSVIGGTDTYVRVVGHEDAIPEDSEAPGPYC